MSTTMERTQDATPAVEHVDVLVVGAGISGIGAAYHLATQIPGHRFVVLEAQTGFGGTWRTHRFPGIRSDSDLYTFGYRFKPWTSAPIATAAEILGYMGEVIDENGLGPHIRYNHSIVGARWSSADKQWTVQATRTDTGEALRFTANFLWMCQGYYRHAEGYTPDWPGLGRFGGRIVHPMAWPDDLALEGKRVVVIGSGATAATLVPAIAGTCAHVTMLQRSPTFYRTGRNAIPIADELRELGIDESWIHEVVRRKIQREQDVFTRRTFAEPAKVREELLANARSVLPPGFDVETHFTPHYRPWQQRIAFIPDADLFQAIGSGRASVVTDHVEAFDETGIRLASGAHLDADVVVTATGFHLCVMGDIPFEVDGRMVDWAQTITYRGMMFTGVPNLAWVFGYFRASWTLRADLVADVICRLLRRMGETSARRVEVALRPEDRDMPILPWIDPDNFNPSYLTRDLHKLPKRGAKPEWQHTQDHWAERETFPAIDLDGPEFVYG